MDQFRNRKKNSKPLRGLFSLVLGTLCFASAGSAQTFVFCSAASPKTLNPQLAVDGTTFTATSQTMFNRLVTFAGTGTEVAPSLAESWKVSKDGLNYTFNLRKNVRFHSTSYFKPTRPFNADDVLFTFNRMRQKSHPYHPMGGSGYEYFESMSMGNIIKNIVKVNDHTVIFILRRPEAPFISNMAMDFASIHSAEYAEKLLKQKKMGQMDEKPIGTGPFVFSVYQPGKKIIFKSHPRYFRGRAQIKKLIFDITTDPSQRYQKLKKGRCHMISDPSPKNIPEMQADQKIRVLKKQGLNISYLAMNTEFGPLKNRRVRQAIHHALDRNSYINQIYSGQAKIASNPIPPTLWGYNNDITDYTYDVKKAKELLKQSGLKKGFSIDLAVLPVTRPYNPNGELMGELMKADLAKVGIEVNLVKWKWNQFLEKAAEGKHQLIQFGWTADNGDPDNFLYSLLSCDAVKGGNNFSRWCNKKFDDLVRKAKETTNKKRRTEFYEQSQVIFKQQVPWVTLAHTMIFRAMKNNVEGYQLSRLGTDNFYSVKLK